MERFQAPVPMKKAVRVWRITPCCTNSTSGKPTMPSTDPMPWTRRLRGGAPRPEFFRRISNFGEFFSDKMGEMMREMGCFFVCLFVWFFGDRYWWSQIISKTWNWIRCFLLHYDGWLICNLGPFNKWWNLPHSIWPTYVVFPGVLVTAQGTNMWLVLSCPRFHMFISSCQF